MHHRLTVFLENNKTIFTFQFGFRNNQSTTHALTNLTEQIHNASGNNKSVCGVFIDLRKAFDPTKTTKYYYPNWNIMVLVVLLCYSFKVT